VRFLFFEDELLFVDLNNQSGAPLITTGEPEFAEGILDALGDVDCVGLSGGIFVGVV